MGVAIGSATQIALFVIPACVLFSWSEGLLLSLNYTAYDTIVIMASVLVVVMIIQHGESHWLHGMLLCGAYLMVVRTSVYLKEF